VPLKFDFALDKSTFATFSGSSFSETFGARQLLLAPESEIRMAPTLNQDFRVKNESFVYE